MILLELFNRIILETIKERLEDSSEKKDVLDIVLADFDGVKLKVSNINPDQRNIVTISISWRCIPMLMKSGASEDLKAIYGSMLQSSPENGYDLSLQFNTDSIPGNKEKFPEAVSLLKRHLIAAPFKKVFSEVEKGTPSNQMVTIAYRDDEAIYIKGEKERATVVFSINFKDPGDQVFAKIFLHEMAEARKGISNAPSVAYSTREAPGELKGVAGVKEDASHGFVTFVLFPNHLNAKNVDRVINNLIIFRDYLHYHIKCTKAHLHTRMRMRVDTMLQLLNRARPSDAAKGEKKTAAGKTFVRK